MDDVCSKPSVSVLRSQMRHRPGPSGSASRAPANVAGGLCCADARVQLTKPRSPPASFSLLLTLVLGLGESDQRPSVTVTVQALHGSQPTAFAPARHS